MKYHVLLAAFLGLAGLSGSATAQTASGVEDARALIDAAIAHYNEVGRAKALLDFTDKSGGFVKGDLYVVRIGPDHAISAHGANATFVGKDIAIFKDTDGKLFADTGWREGLSKGSTMVDYRWTDPLTKKIRPKSSFFVKFGEGEVCSVGFYKS